MRISDWSSDVCSSDLEQAAAERIIAANCDCGIHIAELTSGTYTPDIAIQAERRFAAGGNAPNAVHIELTRDRPLFRSEEHTSEIQSLMRILYAVCCLKKKIATCRTIRRPQYYV